MQFHALLLVIQFYLLYEGALVCHFYCLMQDLSNAIRRTFVRHLA